ncbi:MAG: hypothetical protein RR397_00265 [Odoribacter sp.]
MKSKLFLLVALFLSLSFTLSSCSDDDDSQTETKPEPITANVSYKMGDVLTLLEMVNIKVEYTGKDGKTIEENVTKTPWEKKIEKANVPFTAKMKITYTKKEGFIPTKDSYEIGSGSGIGFTTTDGQFAESTVNSTLTIAKDQIQNYIAEIIKNPKEKMKEIKANK